MILHIAAGIILAVVLLIVGLIVLGKVLGFFGDLIEVHRIRQRGKWTPPDQPPDERPHQTLAEWQRANL